MRKFVVLAILGMALFGCSDSSSALKQDSSGEYKAYKCWQTLYKGPSVIDRSDFERESDEVFGVHKRGDYVSVIGNRPSGELFLMVYHKELYGIEKIPYASIELEEETHKVNLEVFMDANDLDRPYSKRLSMEIECLGFNES